MKKRKTFLLISFLNEFILTNVNDHYYFNFRHVSRHELFPLKAPLMAMEHCIAPFLDGCDANDDHKITLKEWGHCLGLEDGNDFFIYFV